MVDALRTMREEDLSSFEVRPDAQGRYVRWADEDPNIAVRDRGGCRSRYLGGGRPSLMRPRTMRGFGRMLRRFDAEHCRRRSTRQASPAVEQAETVLT